ncbi:hypothetical protein PGT21_036074 [Puccinia graminis f. sp. tritici]|uniref:Uncharacterized protein n=1 Tax=Puccinia graminis f. sp. tritici TaxID=56615 RepID=A0A5B0MJI9_PUCGR|nr:hypothetical protein PGTUg99_037315 [Puccinia graminis f. sp. tritici]KAA1091596.1 hypothetical protein PGT21_036074 [Puccinia graminis f. sp. tritici]
MIVSCELGGVLLLACLCLAGLKPVFCSLWEASEDRASWESGESVGHLLDWTDHNGPLDIHEILCSTPNIPTTSTAVQSSAPKLERQQSPLPIEQTGQIFAVQANSSGGGGTSAGNLQSGHFQARKGKANMGSRSSTNEDPPGYTLGSHSDHVVPLLHFHPRPGNRDEVYPLAYTDHQPILENASNLETGPWSYDQILEDAHDYHDHLNYIGTEDLQNHSEDVHNIDQVLPSTLGIFDPEMLQSILSQDGN